MANQLEAMQDRVNQRAEVSMNLMSSQMSAMLANFNKSMKASSDTLASGVKNILESSDNFITPLANTSNMARTLTKLLSQTDTQFVVPLLNGNNLANQLKKLESSGGGSEKLPDSKKQETLPDITKAKPELPGMWQSFKDGSLRDMWRNLVSEIKEYKGVVALTAITMAAWDRETHINTWRQISDELDRGSEALGNFKSVVERVAVETGMSFEEIGQKAVDVRKELNLTWGGHQAKEFYEFLSIQARITKATGISDIALNKYFLTVRIGTKNIDEMNRVAKRTEKVLLTLMGKPGVSKEDVNEFLTILGRLRNAMSAEGATEEAKSRAENQWSNALTMFGEIGLSKVSLKIQEALARFKRNPELYNLLVGAFKISPEILQKALETGDSKNIWSIVSERLTYMAKEALRSGNFGGFASVIQELFGEEMVDPIIASVRNGKLQDVLKDLIPNLDEIREPNRLEQIMTSINNSIKSIKTSMTGLWADLGDAPLKRIAHWMEVIAGYAKSWNNYFQTLPESTKVLISDLALLGLGFIILSPLIASVRVALFGLRGASMAASSVGLLAGIGPTGWVILGLAAAAAGVYLIATNWDWCKEKLQNHGLSEFAEWLETTGTKAKDLASYVVDIGKSLYSVAESYIANSPNLQKFGSWIKDVASFSGLKKVEDQVGRENIYDALSLRASYLKLRAKKSIAESLGNKEGVADIEAQMQEVRKKYGELMLKHMEHPQTTPEIPRTPQPQDLMQSTHQNKTGVIPPTNIPSVLPEAEKPKAALPSTTYAEAFKKSLNEIQESSKAAIAETYKSITQTPQVEKSQVEPPASGNRIEVEGVDEILAFIKRMYEKYMLSQDKSDSKSPYQLQSMTNAEANAYMERLGQLDSWGGTI